MVGTPDENTADENTKEVSITFGTIPIMRRWIKKKDQLEGGTGYGVHSEELSKLDDKVYK